MEQLYALAKSLNALYGLELDLDHVKQLYGEYVLQTIAEDPEGFREKIEWLLEQGFADTTADICNRYGILFCQCSEEFISGFEQLLARLGQDYADKIAEDLSLLEALL